MIFLVVDKEKCLCYAVFSDEQKAKNYMNNSENLRIIYLGENELTLIKNFGLVSEKQTIGLDIKHLILLRYPKSDVVIMSIKETTKFGNDTSHEVEFLLNGKHEIKTWYSKKYGTLSYQEESITNKKQTSMRRAIFIPQLEEASANPIQLTHRKGNNGWKEISPTTAKSFLTNPVKVVYLGNCLQDGDMFSVQGQDGYIRIFKGELNSGNY